MLLLLCSCPNDDEGPVRTCKYASDLEKFHFMGTDRPGIFYQRDSEDASTMEIDFNEDSATLVFNDDNTFNLYARVVCNSYFHPLPFCELKDDRYDNYIIEISGYFDFTQWYGYSVNLYNYYPRTTPPLSDRIRVRYIKGNFYLNITESTISSHIGETITGDMSVSCQWILGGKYANYDLSFKLPMFTSTDVLNVSIHNSYNLQIFQP